MYLIRKIGFIFAFLCLNVAAQENTPDKLWEQQIQRQKEREDALRSNIESSESELQPKDIRINKEIPENENPCFPIRSINLIGEDISKVTWLLDYTGVDINKTPCIGVKGIEVILERMQNALIAQGYVTSRVLSIPQNLKDGNLNIAFVPGILREIRFSPESIGNTSIKTSFPSVPGELLQLRDIEQGLENLKRIPTADASIKIEPSEGEDVKPGESDLVILYEEKNPVRFNLSIDNGGVKSTGKNQGTAIFSLNNIFGINDIFYFSAGRGIANERGRGTNTWSLNYSVPFGYWLGSFSASNNEYNQEIAGAYQNYKYSGKSNNLDVRISRVVHRNSSSKTLVGFKVFRRSSNNYIDDTEINVQRRRTSGYDFSISRVNYIGSALLDTNFIYRRGIGAFSALPAPEEAFGEGTSRMRLYILSAGLTLPVNFFKNKLTFTSNWHGQINKTPLTTQDKIGIGGRYTVRGFDGESTLLADRGWYWRNEVSMPLNLGAVGHSNIFLALDTGRVSGASTKYLAGNSLTGAALGFRGSVSSFSYEAFVGKPIKKPNNFQTSSTNFAVSLVYNF